MNLEAFHEKIIVLPFPATKETASGIIIPETAQERPSKATVVAVGGGTKDRPMEIEVGDVVFHIKNAGTPIEDDGVLYYFLRDVDCHGRIKKK